MLNAHNSCGNPGRSGHILSLTGAEIVYDCRKRLALLFGTTPERVILTSGATEALNKAIKGVNRQKGVTLVSSLEHNSVIRPVNALRRAGMTVMKQFSVDITNENKTLESFSCASREATTVVVTHASNVCGLKLPVEKMRALCARDTVIILDASQTAGHFPLDIRSLGVDIMCIPGHKGLYGPMGTGALIVNPESDIIIDPIIEGGTGTDSKSLVMPELLPERLEAGTLNVCGLAGLAAAAEELIYPKNEMKVFEYLVSSMRNRVDIIMYGEPKEDCSRYVPVLLFNKKGRDCEEICSSLADNGIACRAGFHCAPAAHRTLGTYETGGVRVSIGRDTRESDIDAFLDVLDRI